MTPSTDRAPTLIEFAVLGLLVEEPQHGFAIAQELAPGTSLGSVYTQPRQAVYRALSRMADRGWVQARETTPSPLGPDRTGLAVTAEGESLFRQWLATPVARVRHVRIDLVLKLSFHERLGISGVPLLETQLPILQDMHDRWKERLPETVDPASALAQWREVSSGAALRFAEEALSRARRAEAETPED